MGMPTTAKELFDTQVPQALAKNPDKAKEIGAVYLFKITGDGRRRGTVHPAAAAPTWQPGTRTAPQVPIEVAHDDFKAMLGNPQLGMQLYFQGKLRVTGDPMLATKLQKLFTMSA